MLSFLDLSTASEEERRLINEILSDTSVVNFAEPLKQQFHQRQLQPTKLQLQNSKTQLNQQQSTKLQQQQPQPQQQPHQQHQQQQPQHHHQHHHNHNQHQQQQQPQSVKINNNTNNTRPQQRHQQHHPNQNHQHHDHQNHYHHQHQGPHHNVNNVIGMDVAPSQPAGYAIPPIPQQTHGFGPPPPPPPHHVYGGPPIFQPYTHYFIPYNLQPYPMPPLVLPPNNPQAVAPSRQQQNEEIIKISPNESVDIQLNLEAPKQAPHESSSNSTDSVSEPSKPKSSQGDNNDSGTEQSTQESTESVDRDEKSHQQNQDIELSPTVTLLAPSQPDCNDSGTEQSTQESTESIDRDEKSQQQSQDINKATAGPWGSAASKSWASLFKGDVCAHQGSSLNGETEPNNVIDSDNSEGEDSKNNQKTNIRLENNNLKNSGTSSEEQRSQDAAKRALDKLAPKLAQKINSITLKHSLPLLRPRGFINKGNGCYINSTLQALIACPPFYNLMKEIGDLKGIKRENSCTPILNSFVELFLNFPPLDANKKNKQATSVDQKLQMNYLQAEAIEPRCIYNVLGQIKSECLKGAQEDAEEFLSSVLNGLHEEMIGLSETLQYVQDNSSNQNGHPSDAEDNNGDLNNDENLWREVGPKNRSLPIRTATVINTPIQEIFGGSLFSIRTAGKDRCGHRSPFFDLQLDISSDNVKSLQDAIKSFTATEIIQDFYCSKTKQKLDAQRRTSLDQLPPILILHLKQFIYTQDHGLKKLMKRIEYPIDFELPDSCLHDKNSDKSLRNSRTYKLLAVVYHEGKEAVKGHYLTDVYHIGSSQWIRCDDSNLKVVPAPRIENPDSSRTPYLLFYRRLNTLGPRQSNSHDNKKKN